MAAVRDLVITLLGNDETKEAFKSAGENAEKLGKVGAGSLASISALAVGAGVALFGIGSKFDESYAQIRVGTGKTGEELEALKGNFKDVVSSVPTSFGDASTAITVLTQKLSLSGQPLEAMSKQYLELSRITKTDLTTNLQAGTDAFNGFGVAAKDQPAKLDELFRASQQSGKSFSDLSGELAANGIQLRGVGLSFDQSTALVATLGKAGMSTADVLPALSKALATAAKGGKDASDVFQDTFTKIKNAPTDTEAAGDALAVFGAKAGPKLAIAIREGKLSYEDMLGSIQGGGDTIMKAGGDTQHLKEKLEIFRNEALVKLEPVAMRVFDKVDEGLKKISEWWDAHGPAVIAGIKRFGDDTSAAFKFVDDHKDIFAIVGAIILASYVPAWYAAGTAAVASATAQVWAWVTTRTEAVVSIATSVAGLLAMAGGWVITAAAAMASALIIAAAWLISLGPIALVIVAVIAIGAALILLWQNSQTFRDIVTGVWNVVWGAIKFVWDWIKGNWPLLLGILTGPIGLAVVEIVKHWDTIKGGVSAVKDWIVARFNDVVGFITGLPGRISGAASGMWDGIKNAFRDAIDWIIDKWNGLQFSIPGVDTHIPGVGSIGGFTLGTPDIPRLAAGGIVRARPGGTLALLAEAGHDEMVTPLDGRHGGSITIENVNITQTDPDMSVVSSALAWHMLTAGV